MLKLPIHCSGGIGDVLMALSSYPISRLGQLGIQSKILYSTPKHPAREIVCPLLSSIKYLEVVDQLKTSEILLSQKITSLFYRTNYLFRPDFVSEKSQLNKQKDNKSFKILLHTHLDGHHGWKGATAKIWSVDKWIELAEKISNGVNQLGILEWDDLSRHQLLEKIPNSVDERGSNLNETISNISGYNLMVSVDSWSKYVAAWFSMKQVILVPDLRVGYCGFDTKTADHIAKKWFRGLINNNNVHVIGLTEENGVYNYSLKSLQEIDINSLAFKINSMK